MRQPGGTRYILKESILENGSWISRDLMDLGDDPAQFIIYPGGKGYYFSPELEEILEEKGVEYEAEELEQVFLPFLRQDIRRVVEMFSHRRSAGMRDRQDFVSDDELSEHHLELHDFDKRRLHFLRFGRIDSRGLDARPWKFLKVLFHRSRDEVEHVIEGMEFHLRPHEWKTYLYSAFDLQSYFQGHLLKHHPIGLDPEKMDACFLDEICRLNRDRRFFNGVPEHRTDWLHGYLRKYVVLYFDSDFGGQRLDPSSYREFVNRRQAYARAVMAGSSLHQDEALTILGLAREDLKCMSQDDLARHYRRIAKTSHPDSGGDHEGFIKITEAYEFLRCRLP
jgi:hypothetical protein